VTPEALFLEIDLSEWMASNPFDVLATNFGSPATLFEKFPHKTCSLLIRASLPKADRCHRAAGGRGRAMKWNDQWRCDGSGKCRTTWKYWRKPCGRVSAKPARWQEWY
jgi:hypothetical protein